MDEHPYDVHMSELLGSDHPRLFACGGSSSDEDSSDEDSSESDEDSSASDEKPKTLRSPRAARELPAAAQPTAAKPPAAKPTRPPSQRAAAVHQPDFSATEYESLGALEDRKDNIRFLSWREFTQRYKTNTPDVRFKGDKAYVPEIFLDPSMQADLDRRYTEYTRLSFAYYKRGQGNTAAASDSCLLLQKGLEPLAWLLFVGLDMEAVKVALRRSDRLDEIDYRDVENVLSFIGMMNGEAIKALHARRKRGHAEFLNSSAWKLWDFCGVSWMVHRDHMLPWMIPISDFHYHNSRAVHWRTATVREMIMCGRLVGANERLYLRTELYKQLFPRLVDMNKHLVHKCEGVDSESAMSLWEENVWDNWHHGKSFFWYKPCFRVCVAPTRNIGHCMFLIFPKSVLADPNKIVVPAFSHVYSFAGEVRPVDLSVSDDYGFDYITQGLKGMKPKKAKRSDSKDDKDRLRTEIKLENARNPKAEMVSTNYVRYERRPGIGSAAYMANHTCGMNFGTPKTYKEGRCRDNEYFYMSSIRVGNKEGNAILKADALMLFISIKSTQDLYADRILEWNDCNKNHTFILFGPMTKEYAFFPVEFVYNRQEPKPPFHTKCSCMTRCSIGGLGENERSWANLINVKSISARAQRRDLDVLAEDVERSLTKNAETSKKRIRRFLAQTFGDKAEFML